jgi:transcriptional regulator with XRE-family HTH domain
MKESMQGPRPKHAFGKKLRIVRLRKGLTMKAVAGSAGISESLLSQIERDRVSPSIDTLLAVAGVLEVDLEYLFSEVKKSKSVDVTRKGDRKLIREAGAVFHRLSRIADAAEEHAIEAVLLELEPGAVAGNTEYGHRGRELGYVLSGTAELSYGGDTCTLRKGDAVSFSSDIPHELKNTGSRRLSAIWVNTPPRVVFPLS